MREKTLLNAEHAENAEIKRKSSSWSKHVTVLCVLSDLGVKKSSAYVTTSLYLKQLVR